MAYTSHPLAAVKDRRRLLHITAAQIASELGMDTNSFGRLERGERRCYLDKALKIANILKCQVEDLGRPLSPEERVELFKQGEQRRAVLDMSDDDPEVAEVLLEWDNDDTGAAAQ